jgi:hypothetical protein
MSYATVAGTARGQESRLFLTSWLRQVFRDPLTAYLVTYVWPASSSIFHIEPPSPPPNWPTISVVSKEFVLRFKNNI